MNTTSIRGIAEYLYRMPTLNNSEKLKYIKSNIELLTGAQLEKNFAVHDTEKLKENLNSNYLEVFSVLLDCIKETQSIRNDCATMYNSSCLLSHIPNVINEETLQINMEKIESEVSKIISEPAKLFCLQQEWGTIRNTLAIDAQLTEIDAQLTKREAQFTKREAQLTEIDAQFTKREAQLTEIDAQLTKREAQLTEIYAQLTEIYAQLTKREAQLTEIDAQLTEIYAQSIDIDAQFTEIDAQLTKREAQLVTSEIYSIEFSTVLKNIKDIQLQLTEAKKSVYKEKSDSIFLKSICNITVSPSELPTKNQKKSEQLYQCIQDIKFNILKDHVTLQETHSQNKLIAIQCMQRDVEKSVLQNLNELREQYPNVQREEILLKLCEKNGIILQEGDSVEERLTNATQLIDKVYVYSEQINVLDQIKKINQQVYSQAHRLLCIKAQLKSAETQEKTEELQRSLGLLISEIQNTNNEYFTVVNKQQQADQDLIDTLQSNFMLHIINTVVTQHYS